jgi:ribosomal protein S18 acetylase RimI-like enzyme
VLSLRRATAADVEVLARIQLDARRAAGDLFPPSLHEDAELVPHLLTDVLPSAEAWLAERDGTAAGILVLEGDLIDQLYVDPSAQGSGIGSALLDHAKAVRPDGLRLWVFVSNEPARAFYATRGFVPIGGSDGEANEEGAPDLLLAWRPRD